MSIANYLGEYAAASAGLTHQSKIWPDVISAIRDAHAAAVATAQMRCGTDVFEETLHMWCATQLMMIGYEKLAMPEGGVMDVPLQQYGRFMEARRDLIEGMAREVAEALLKSCAEEGSVAKTVEKLVTPHKST